MVKQQQRRDRCFGPATVNGVTQVRLPVGPMQWRPPVTQQVSGRKAGPGTGNSDSWPCCRSTTTEEERGDPGSDGCPGETETKRARLDGAAETAPLTNRHKLQESCDHPGREGCSTGGILSRRPPLDQQGSAEHSEDSRAAELQTVGSLKVTIQQSSESREFGRTDRTADTQTGGLHCHICNVTCRSLQVFQEHMAAPEHLTRLKDITQSVCINTHTLQDRGRQPDRQRWCDTCQTHFSSDVITHRRTKQHKMCKQVCRPFCPVCRRHFRTPRKFVEHMKSAEHKQQVHLQEAQEEELITVDAVGCFEGEEEVEEEEVEVQVEPEPGGEEEADGVGTEEEVLETADTQETHREEYDPHTTYGSSFVVPVCGFLCRLCNKFFHREATARHTHCRTHTHYLNLQSHRAAQRRRDEDKDGPALSVSHNAPVPKVFSPSTCSSARR